MHVIAALLMAAATRATDLNRAKIAVCVAGMPERLQPGPLLEHLVLANGDFEFDVVYALAAPSALFSQKSIRPPPRRLTLRCPRDLRPLQTGRA